MSKIQSGEMVSGPGLQLSSLSDGELGSAEAAMLTQDWQRNASMRETWHAYQLIGDVLRSDDLAVDPARDEAFLQRLRAQLASEPVVMAPSGLALPVAETVDLFAEGTTRVSGGMAVRPGRAWQRPMAVAAGFVAVAGVAMMMRGGDPSGGSGQMAASSASGSTITAAGAVREAADARLRIVPVADGAVIRDAQLDRYLQAHRQYSLDGQLGTPAGYVRNTDLTAPAR